MSFLIHIWSDNFHIIRLILEQKKFNGSQMNFVLSNENMWINFKSLSLLSAVSNENIKVAKIETITKGIS